MELAFTLCLPREEASVPVVRHLCTSCLERLGVEDDCIADIEVAVSEACTNVLKHAATEDEYQVTVKIRQGLCDIQVIDRGAHFDHSLLDVPQPIGDQEGGRGVHLMRAMVDELHFVSQPEAGMAVHLAKGLRMREAAAWNKLAARLRR